MVRDTFEDVSFISVKKQFMICGEENGTQNLHAKYTKLNPYLYQHKRG